MYRHVLKRDRRPGDLVFAVLFLCFSIFLLTQLGEQTQVTKRTKWFAQPALWPSIAVYGMVVFSALHCVTACLSNRQAGRWAEVVFWLKSLEYVAYFLVYVVLVPLLGYLPSTVVFAIFLTIRCGFRSGKAISCAIVFAIGVSLLFRAFLQVKIPAGQLYEYLPDAIRLFALSYL